MSKPKIPSEWNPLTYAVDEHNKVVWKQGSYAVAMGLAGKEETLIPGYKVYLCTSAELPAVRHRIKVEQEQRDERELDEFTPEEEEELGRMFADGWMRRRKPVKEEPKKNSMDPLARLCVVIEKIPFRSHHGFAIATVMALIAAINLDGGKYQNASNSYLALAGIGAFATHFSYKHRDD